MKIDWPVVCAFVLFGCMIGLSGRRLDNWSGGLLFAVFLLALVGLAGGLAFELLKKGKRP